MGLTRQARLGRGKSYQQFESLSLRQLGRSRVFSARTCRHISPVEAAISRLNSGLQIDRAGSLFSEWPISLWSSGLCGFGTVLEIRMFREAYEF